jgi:pyruvate-ferredoxin/flavodoxin oxidoreductase
VGGELAGVILTADQTTEAGIAAQRVRIAELKQRLSGIGSLEARDLLAVADSLVVKSVWLVGWLAVMDGPTTLAPAAWITSWARA